MDWKALVSQAAPTIARALGGPLAGSAVSFICDALGLPPNTPEEKIEQKIKEDPNVIADLRKAELAFQQHLDDNKIELSRIVMADKQSARAMHLQLKDLFPNMLASVIVFGFFLVVYLVWEKDAVPPDTKDLANILFGVLAAKFSSIVDFYYGSSRD